MPKKRYHAVKDDLAALVERKNKSDELFKRREEQLLQTIVAMQKRIEHLEGTPPIYQLTHQISRLYTVRAWILCSLGKYHLVEESKKDLARASHISIFFFVFHHCTTTT